LATAGPPCYGLVAFGSAGPART